jgi:hypothetical protein
MSSGSIDPNPIELYSNEDIEKEFELIKDNSWIYFSKNELNLEFKKKCISENLESAQRVHNEIKEYMETDEYKNGIHQFENMNADKAFSYYYNSRVGLYIEYTDSEKRALAVKSVAEQKQQDEYVEKYMPTNEFTPNTEYIFFSIEFGSFATRMILVPKKEFTEIYADKLDMLRRNSAKTYEENGIVINELITYYKRTSKSCWSGVLNEFTEFLNGMQTFAECESHSGACYGVLGNNFPPSEQMDIDRTWYIKSVCCGGTYFNPQTGRMELTEEAISKGCSVSECFLFSNVREGEEYTKQYEYDTVHEFTDSLCEKYLSTDRGNDCDDVCDDDCGDGW